MKSSYQLLLERLGKYKNDDSEESFDIPIPEDDFKQDERLTNNRYLRDIADIGQSFQKIGSIGGDYYKSDTPEFFERKERDILEDLKNRDAKKLLEQKSMLSALDKIRAMNKEQRESEQSTKDNERKDKQFNLEERYKNALINQAEKRSELDPLQSLRGQEIQSRIDLNKSKLSNDSDIPKQGLDTINRIKNKYVDLDTARTNLDAQTSTLQDLYKNGNFKDSLSFAKTTIKPLLNATSATAEAVGAEEAKRLASELEVSGGNLFFRGKPIDIPGFITKLENVSNSIDKASKGMKSDVEGIIANKDWLGLQRGKPKEIIKNPVNDIPMKEGDTQKRAKRNGIVGTVVTHVDGTQDFYED